MIEICFVCTGNTCRSIMAERIAKKMAKNLKIENIKFSSAGLNAKGDNITENAQKALKSLGYDGRTRKSVLLKKIKPTTLYVAMTKSHKDRINAKKVICFDDLSCGVDDPYGKSLEVYVSCAKQIEQNVSILLKQIENLRRQ